MEPTSQTLVSVQPHAFCLLMAVYSADKVDQVQRALHSSTCEQTWAPSQVVIVRDGPVSPELQDFLDSLPALLEQWFSQADRQHDLPILTVLELDDNGGLAAALNRGLAACSCEIVARADSDDISLPHRFQSIIAKLDPIRVSQCDVVGSAVQEFTGDEHDRGQIRALPSGGQALMRFARMRSPLHHPSVAFRKSAVMAVGGYPEHAGKFEDYLLWERMILNGSRLCNIASPLVLYRVDSGAYQRRGGRQMFSDEVRLQRQFLRDGFTTPWEYVRNILIRALYRLLPVNLRRRGYRMVTAVRGVIQRKAIAEGRG